MLLQGLTTTLKAYRSGWGPGGRCLGIGFVKFASPCDAAKAQSAFEVIARQAAAEMHQKVVDQRTLHVERKQVGP